MVKADDLIKEQKKRNKIKIKTFIKIYNKIEKKITLASASNFYYCWYEIPEFILGMPIYSLQECKVFIEKKLIEDGFKVKFYESNIIMISWYPDY